MKPSTRKLIAPVPPTAASAFTPTYLPTIMESAILYICWKRFPKSIGTAKPSIALIGLPLVKSLIIAASHLRN